MARPEPWGREALVGTRGSGRAFPLHSCRSYINTGRAAQGGTERPCRRRDPQPHPVPGGLQRAEVEGEKGDGSVRGAGGGLRYFGSREPGGPPAAWAAPERARWWCWGRTRTRAARRSAAETRGGRSLPRKGEKEGKLFKKNVDFSGFQIFPKAQEAGSTQGRRIPPPELKEVPKPLLATPYPSGCCGKPSPRWWSPEPTSQGRRARSSLRGQPELRQES